MSSPEKKYKALRLVAAGGLLVAGTVVGATVKAGLDKQKTSAAITEQQPGGIAPSQKAFNELVTATPTFSPTPEPSAEQIVTTEAAKPEDVPCIIVSPEACAKAVRLEEPSPLGGVITYIGLNLQPDEIIKAPISGQMIQVELKQPAPYQGSRISIINSSNGIAVYVTGDLKLKSMLTRDVQVGEDIALVGNRGITNRGNFNVLINASRIDPTLGKAVGAIEFLEKSFPQAFKTPAIQVKNPNPGQQYFSGNVYLEKK